MQSWIIYNISTGQILCYGREIDVIADQEKIDQGDTSVTLYAIQQLCLDPDVEVIYGAPCDVDPLSFNLCEVDHATQSITGMPIADIKIEITKRANNDIVNGFSAMNSLSQCVERIQAAIPGEAALQTAIDNWMDGLELAKSTITAQVSAISTTVDALNYYNQRSWLAVFPDPVEWEEM